MISVRHAVRNARDWLSLKDYTRAVDEAINTIVFRYARGNISFQNGSVMQEDDLQALSQSGSSALDRLNRVGNPR
jgi:hypothetical protein